MENIINKEPGREFSEKVYKILQVTKIIKNQDTVEE